MPVKRRIRRQRREAWGHQHVVALRSGQRYFDAFGGNRRPWNLDEARLAWADLRDEIMEQYRVSKPCRRPWGFWMFELQHEMPLRASEQRRYLLDHGHLDADERAMIAANPAMLEPKEPWFLDR